MPGDDQLTEDEFAAWLREAGWEQLAEILYWQWDPIGVNDAFPATRGEYDNYPERIAAELRQGGGAMEVEAVLVRIERDDMGLDPVPILEERRQVALFIAESWFEESVGYWQRGGRDWRRAQQASSHHPYEHAQPVLR